MGWSLAVLGLGVGLGMVAVGGALGIGRIGAAAAEGTARQPEAAGNIRTTAIILAALIEGFVFLAIILALVLSYQAIGKAETASGAAAQPAPAVGPQNPGK